ncbi:MAG TPA: SCO family protein [Thermoanaerobaculia bacterium]|nr:SCO family protein [Thermoanaerobaculia bacterium]
MRTTIYSLALLLAAGLLPAAAQDGHEHHRQALQAAAQAPAAPEAEPLGSLNVPDVALVDQNGKPVRFYTDLVKGRVVVMNFVFTTCTTICPPMGANFAKLQKLLAGKDVRLISVSVDPATDTPERLKAWAQKFGAGPGWTLVTGNKDEVIRLLKALGVYTAGVADHSPLVLVGNDPGHRWTRAYGLAPPVRLAELIDQIAAPAAGAKKESR